MGNLDGLEDVVKEFLSESAEALDHMEKDFVELEENPASSREIIARVFRAMHTIKGTCGFLAFHKLEKLTHSAENVLARLRDGKLELTPAMITAFLKSGDAVRFMLAMIESQGDDGENAFPELIATLDGFLQTDAPPADNALKT